MQSAKAPILTAHGAKMPAIGFGTMELPHRPAELVAAAIAAGYRHIDTARKYGTEERVGEGIRASGIARKDLFVTTKVTELDAREADFLRSAETSLKALGLDYVDLLLVHWPQPKVPFTETLGALAKAKRRGMVRIGHLLDKMPAQCSGGESQRVALARTLVTNPSTFLLDEPLSSLDAKLRRELRAECDRLHQVLKRTFIFVTHDQEEAMTLADRIVVMRARRNHVGAAFDQLAPCGEDALPAGRRSGFDNDERIGGQSPKPLNEPRPILRGQLVQHISQGDQIARFAIDFVQGNIGRAPGRVWLLHLRRQLLSERTENRTCFDQQCVGESRPAVSCGPERGARTSANIERSLRREIRAGFSDRGEARAHRRIGRRQAHREIREHLLIARDVCLAVVPFLPVAL